MSTVKPLRELAPSEDVIDIKPEPDDLIDEDLNFVQENPLSQKKTTVTLTYGSSRPSMEIYRPPASRNTDSGAHLNRLQFQQQQNSIHAAKQLDIQSSRVYETGRLCEPEVLNSLEETYSPFFRSNAEKMSIEVCIYFWILRCSAENCPFLIVSCIWNNITYCKFVLNWFLSCST